MVGACPLFPCFVVTTITPLAARDRKSTRLNSSHVAISYAVFCLKKKKKNGPPQDRASGAGRELHEPVGTVEEAAGKDEPRAGAGVQYTPNREHGALAS